MVKRYDLDEWKGCALGPSTMGQYDDGDYILASDFDRMRRRLAASSLRDRARFYRKHKDYWARPETRHKVRVFMDLSRAITRNEPLEYFNRLGQDK